MLDNILTILFKPIEFVCDYFHERKLSKTDAKTLHLWELFFTEGTDRAAIQAKIAKKIEKIETKVLALQAKSPGKIKHFHEYFTQRAAIHRATFEEILYPKNQINEASYSPEQQLQECEAAVNKQWQVFYKTLSIKDLKKVNTSVHEFKQLAAAFEPANEYFRQAAEAHLLALNDLFPALSEANRVPQEQKQKRGKLQFIQDLQKHFEVRDIKGDGNCLLRAIVNCKSPKIVNDAQSEEKRIKNLRSLLVNYISHNEHYFRPFVTEQDIDMANLNAHGDDPFENYLRDIAYNGTWLGNVELPALSEILHRPIWVYQHEGVIEREGLPPIPKPEFCFGTEKYPKDEPLKVLYVNGNHYIALIPKAKAD